MLNNEFDTWTWNDLQFTAAFILFLGTSSEPVSQATGNSIWFDIGILVLAIGMYSYILFAVCLIQIPSLCLDRLSRQIYIRKFTSTTEIAELVCKWKKHYLLIHDLVVHISYFLGKTLVVFIVFVLMTTFTSIYFLFSFNLNNSPGWNSLFNETFLATTGNMTCLILLVIVTEKISQKVSEKRDLAFQK